MERKYLLPPDKPIFQVRDHVYWAASTILKDKYGTLVGRSELSDYVEKVYDDLEALGYKILIWSEEADTLYLRGNVSNLSPIQRKKINDLVFKIGEEGTSFKVTLEDDCGNYEELWSHPTNESIIKFSKFHKLLTESISKVSDYLHTNNYVIHGTDDIRRAESILRTGLRPKTQMSDSEGQGLDSGPYIFVYSKKNFRGDSVSYRPGDYTNTKVKGGPRLILFDDSVLCDSPPIEKLESDMIAAHQKMEEYISQKYPGVILSDKKHDWKAFAEA